MPWETVISLRIYVQFNTQSKIFSDAPTEFGAESDVYTCAEGRYNAGAVCFSRFQDRI